MGCTIATFCCLAGFSGLVRTDTAAAMQKGQLGHAQRDSQSGLESKDLNDVPLLRLVRE